MFFVGDDAHTVPQNYTKINSTLVGRGLAPAANLQKTLRRLRDASGLSQEKLCAELQRRGCDIGRTTYAKYEAGELNIRAGVIIALKKIYDCSYDDFFSGLD